MNKIVGLALVILASSYARSQAAPGRDAKAVIMIDIAQGKQVISINGEATPAAQVLFKLSDVRRKMQVRSEDAPAIVIAHERTTVYDLLSMHTALMKAGFGTVRYFSFDKQKNSMFEITFSKSLPFEASGPPDRPN